MKVAAAALLLALGSASAFAPQRTAPLSKTTKLASTVEAEAVTPERTAPSAGWEPEWEGREGLTPEEFMKSDPSKPDISGMWECPLTRWDASG